MSLRARLIYLLALQLLVTASVSQAHPPVSGFGVRLSKQHDQSPQPETRPANFRCVLVGDSQVSSPHGKRLRPHMRLWDFPTAGAFFSTNFIWAGQLIDFNVDHLANLSSRELTNPDSWTHGGPRDFLTQRAYEWICDGDIKDSKSPFATVLLYNEYPNLHGWEDNWMRNQTLVMRIAVRTTPQTAPMIETAARRGTQVDDASRTKHALPQEYGVVIIEQLIRSDFFGGVDGAGIEMYFPDGVVEAPGMTVQMLGASLLVVDVALRPMPGHVMGSIALPGWGLDDHLAITDASRDAAIRLIDANSMMVMLGHNRDTLPEPGVMANYRDLMQRFSNSFLAAGVQNPTNIHVVPWITGTAGSGESLREIAGAMYQYASEHDGELCSFVEYFDEQIPDDFDPRLYTLDEVRIHPGTDMTAYNLSLDLELMLREGYADR